jgi:hypothetical protein
MVGMRLGQFERVGESGNSFPEPFGGAYTAVSRIVRWQR